jgi:SAM-dependent methyltransferase
MRHIRNERDAFGLEMASYLRDRNAIEIVERDDGFIDAKANTRTYFAKFRQWPKRQRDAIRGIRAVQALDIGCGPGRVALYLQGRGIRTTAIDNSAMAIQIAKSLGVKDARVLSIDQLRTLGPLSFDLIVMYGNNFGLLRNPKSARRILRRLYELSNDNAVLLAESLDPYQTSEPAHLQYHRQNKKRGKLPGQVRLRIRFKSNLGHWFDYLLVSPREMRSILEGSGWRMRRIFRDKGPLYVAVIEKRVGWPHSAPTRRHQK